jgi:predicted AlkP superfamily phosphohydrolase/phosphomutase
LSDSVNWDGWDVGLGTERLLGYAHRVVCAAVGDPAEFPLRIQQGFCRRLKMSRNSTGDWAFQSGFGAGMLAGTILGYEIAAMGGLLVYAKDLFVLVLVFSIISALIFGLVFSLLNVLLKAVFRHKKGLEQKTAYYRRSAAIFVIVCSQAMFGFVELFRPISLRKPTTIGALLVVAVLSAVLSHLLSLWFSKFKARNERFVKRRTAWIFSYLVGLVIVTGTVSFTVSHTSLRQQPLASGNGKGRILLLGLDAADWNTLSPLIKNGKLPNLERLVREGASGNLTSLVSPWGALAADTITYGIESPSIWTSILTGKQAWKHGISDFVVTEIPFVDHPFRHRLVPAFVPNREPIEKMLGLQIRPFNRFLRKCKAAWNIFSDSGLKASALGWWDTWPAEEVNGVILSDRFADPSLMKKWYPSSMISEAEMASTMADLKSVPMADLKKFTTFPYNPRYSELYDKDSYDYIRNELLSNFISNFLLDKFKSHLGISLFGQNKYDFLGVYYYALDVAGHAFTRFKQPELFVDLESRDVSYFGEIIDKYCIWFDSELGKYLGGIDPDTTVIICSDHGMGPWHAVTSMQHGVRLSGSHREQGVLIMWGNHIRKGWRIGQASVLDILPTSLYLAGLPVAKDMDGSVIQEALDQRFLSSAPILATDTYESERYQYRYGPGVGSMRAGDKRQIEKLRSLGYLK